VEQAADSLHQKKRKKKLKKKELKKTGRDKGTFYGFDLTKEIDIKIMEQVADSLKKEKKIKKNELKKTGRDKGALHFSSLKKMGAF
jgi:hypothetical protein